MKRIITAALALLFILSAFPQVSASAQSAPMSAESKGATELTEQANAAFYQLLDFTDTQELEFAERGFIAALGFG